jgi:hypothetical protein
MEFALGKAILNVHYNLKCYLLPIVYVDVFKGNGSVTPPSDIIPYEKLIHLFIFLF